MKTTNLIKTSVTLLVAGVLSSLVACGGKGGDSQPTNPYGYQNCTNCQNINGANIFFRAQSQDYYGVITVNWNFAGQATTGYPNQPYPNFPQPAPYPNYGSQPYGQQPMYGQPYNQQYLPGYNGGYYYGGGYQFNNTYGYNNGSSPVVSYNGPVAVSGQFIVSQGMNLGYCQLPGGTYSLNTIQAGQWYSSFVSGLRMQAAGPANIILSLSQGQVSAKTGAQLGYTWNEVGNVGRIFGNLVIESVNGYNCQMSVLVQ